MNFDGGPFSVGRFSGGDHIREPDRVADEHGYTMDRTAEEVSKHLVV